MADDVFAQLDLSTLPALPELPAGAVPIGGATTPPAGAIPLAQIPPGALSDTGAPAGAVPLASVEPGHIQSEQQHLDASPRAALVDEAVQDITSGNPDVTKYRDAYRKKAYTYNLLDEDNRPKPDTGNLLQKGFQMGEDMFEGTFAAMNEAGKTLGLDVMAARMKTDAERKAQPGGTPFLLPAVSTKEGEQAAHQIISTAAAKSVQAADLIRTFTNRVANKILANSLDADQPDAEMAKIFDTQFDHDVAVKMAVKGLEQGVSSRLPATNEDTMATLAKTPVLDPTMFIPAGASFEAARAGEGLAARTLADTPVTIEQHLVNLAGKAAAKPFAVAGKTLSRTSELIDGNPLLKATAAAGATMAVGGDAVQSGLAALLGANTKLKLLEKGGESFTTIADKLAGKTPPGPMGRFALSVANTVGNETRGIVAGQIANLPFALGAGDEDSFKDMVTAGVLMHSAMKPVGALVNGLDLNRNLWAERPSMPETRLNVKPYGIDASLDAAHKKVADTLGNSANNYVQSIRDYFGKQRGEVYTLYPADYDAALAKFVADGLLDATTAAQARGQQGVSLKLPDGEGGMHNIAISRVAGNTPGLSVGHEAGHMLESLLSPEELAHVYKTIENTYGPEQLAAYKTRYEELANFNKPANIPPLSLNASQLLSEIFAEHASAVLNSIPVHSFGEPGTRRKDLSRVVYSMVARGLEKIGAKVPQLVDFSGEAGPKTGLGIQPSAKLGNLIENVLAAHALDLPKLRYNTPSGKAPLTEAQKTLSPEENVARPVANVRTTSERQNQFGEATPEQMSATQAHLDTAFAGARHEIKPVEIEYLSAKDDSESIPNQKEREAQRLRADALEEAAQASGLPNPLRQKYQKVAVPYGYAREDKSLVHAMSLDKVVSNVDLMQGWLHLNQEQTGKLGSDLSQYLASPQLTKDLQVYLRNQSHGFAGDGRELVRPSDAREGTITPQDDAYKPTTLPPDKAQVINMLMGMEQPGKQSPGQEFARRFAEANGIEAPRVNGVTDTNPLRARLRTEMGFDPKILNAAVEVLKTNRIVDLKERPDLHFNAGDTAFQRAGFMPQLAGPRLEHSVKDKTLSLVHYGDQGLREIGTKHFGRSGLTPGSELAGEPRSYWYVQGKENKHDPVLGRGAKYEASVSGNRIYDGDADPLDYGSVINRSKADSMLQDAGYSGIARTGRGGYRQVELFEPVKPENVQQTRKAASFMPNAEPAEPFYSPLEKTLRALPDKANRGQIEAALRGTKAEEMRDVRDPAGQTFEDYLRQHPEAGKQELLDFASQHKVEVNEQEIGRALTPNEQTEYDELNFMSASKMTAPEIRRFRELEKKENSSGTKYENYVLPGGHNYREQVFTLPNKEYEGIHRQLDVLKHRMTQMKKDPRWKIGGSASNYGEYDILRQQRDDLLEKAVKARGYKSPHFPDVSDYLAHARYNERESPEGSILHAEEIQSDLHQKGRKKGYVRTLTPEEKTRKEVLDEISNRRDFTPEEQTEYDSMRDTTGDSGVPDAPFKKSWHELVFKNLLRTAAEQGKDFLSWTTGEQQAERYDLSKHIQRVTLQKAIGHSDKLYLSAHDHNGRRVVDKMIDGPEQVEDYVGKEAAKKLVEQPWTPYTEETNRGGSITSDHKQLSGLDLKVGGEGMKGFYDQILPRFADKYLKKYGVKTEKLPLSTGYTDPALKRYVGDGKGSDQLIPTKVHAVRITPEMRKDILEKGQPLYMPQTDKLSDFKADTLLEALKRPGWAVVTGTQEAQGSPDAPANVAANAKLEKHLQDKRIPYQKVGGSYKGVDQGPSFLIHANEEQAQKLSKQYGQESVLTSRGLLYQNGSITPAVSTDTKVGAEAAKQDFHSTLLDGTPFSVGLDFSQRISPSDLSKARVSAPRRG